MIKTIVYIDGANLHKGTEELGWKLDYKRFRIWLTEKYNTSSAKIFIGKIPTYRDIYDNFKESGFELVFKEITYNQEKKIKGIQYLFCCEN